MCGALVSRISRSVERLPHQAELVVLQVAQAAVDQLGAPLRRRARRGRRLGEQHGQAAPGGIARYARAVDAAADDQDVAGGRSRSGPCRYFTGCARMAALPLHRQHRSRAGRARGPISEMNLLPEIAALDAEMREWRHHHPPASGNRLRGSRDQRLRRRQAARVRPARCTPGIARTGVVGVLSHGASGDAIGLRADLDALHIHETERRALRVAP